MLKELSNRLDKFSSTPTQAAAGKVTVTGVGRLLSGDNRKMVSRTRSNFSFMLGKTRQRGLRPGT